VNLDRGAQLGATFPRFGGRSPASAGMHPVQGLPGFFRFPHSWLPLRHLSDGVRAVTFAAARHRSRRLARAVAGGPQGRSVADPDAAVSAGVAR